MKFVGDTYKDDFNAGCWKAEVRLSKGNIFQRMKSFVTFYVMPSDYFEHQVTQSYINSLVLKFVSPAVNGIKDIKSFVEI